MALLSALRTPRLTLRCPSRRAALSSRSSRTTLSPSAIQAWSSSTASGGPGGPATSSACPVAAWGHGAGRGLDPSVAVWREGFHSDSLRQRSAQGQRILRSRAAGTSPFLPGSAAAPRCAVAGLTCRGSETEVGGRVVLEQLRLAGVAVHHRHAPVAPCARTQHSFVGLSRCSYCPGCV